MARSGGSGSDRRGRSSRSGSRRGRGGGGRSGGRGGTTNPHYPRTARLNALLQEIVANYFERVQDEALGFVTITGVEVDNDPPARRGMGGFHVPLDLAWTDAEGEQHERLWLDPGNNALELPTAGPARDLRVVGLQRVLGKHLLQ